jgi:hypothetical protein
MKRFKIENLSEVADAMYSDIANNDLNEVEFIGFYEDVSTVLKNLLIFDETIPCFIKMVDPECDDYEKEYSIILDSDMNIWCEKAYMDDNYLFVISEKVYVADDCNSKLLENIETCEDRVYEVTYGLDNNKSEKDSHGVLTRIVKDKDGKLKGFEKTWDTFEEDFNYHSTYSFFSSNEDMLKNMLENFDIKY